MSARGGTAPGVSAYRIAAMVERYWYLLRSSWPRLLEIIYWPAVQLLTWGFLQTYLMRAGALNTPGGGAQAAGTLIGAILLWDILLLLSIYQRTLENKEIMILILYSLKSIHLK